MYHKIIMLNLGSYRIPIFIHIILEIDIWSAITSKLKEIWPDNSKAFIGIQKNLSL